MSDATPLTFDVDVRDAAGAPISPLATHPLSSLHAAIHSATNLSVDVSSTSDATLRVSCGPLPLASLHELRDAILSGGFDARATQSLRALSADAPPLELRARRTLFAEQFEASALSLDALTPHQQEKLDECAAADASSTSIVHLHVRAPAGSGKTFVALHRLLAALRRDDDALYVARNAALCLFAASWVAKRAASAAERRRLLARLHVLHAPVGAGVQACRLVGTTIALRRAPPPDGGYALVVVDEAHHLYADAASRTAVEAHVGAQTARLLLSDLSQSLGRQEAAYPPGLRAVEMHEVVRCSKRIVAGAMAFQLGGEEKLLTRCVHEATGPPLKSFLFDVDATADRHEAYAAQVVRALDHAAATFPGLALHHRLAIVTPDAPFAAALRPPLRAALRAAGWRLRLVDAAAAAAEVGPAADGDDAEAEAEAEAMDDGDGDGDGDDGDDDEGDWIVVDEVRQMDGLERLIVIAVGLDAPVAAAAGDGADGAALETRSALYRAVTRAQLMVLVVNEFLPGGWLEFLGHVRLRAEGFDRREEMARAEARAVEGVVLSTLAAALAAAAEAAGAPLPAAATSWLSTQVAARLESGEAQAAAVAAELDGWQRTVAQVAAALAREAAKHPLRPAAGDAEMAAACDELALGVLNGAIARLDGALASALAKWRHARCAEAIEAAARAVPTRAEPSVVAAARRESVATYLGARWRRARRWRPRWRGGGVGGACGRRPKASLTLLAASPPGGGGGRRVGRHGRRGRQAAQRNREGELQRRW